jgi:hypothetical protein
MICVAGFISRAPDMIFKIAWNEVSTATLHNILTVKEWANPVALFVAAGWLGIYSYFEPVWTLKLSNPINKVWGGDRSQVKRFGFVTLLSALLAGSIALSKAFS